MCAPVGRCIYCGTRAGRLTDEHLIPFSLGGMMYLPNASCDSCARITSRFEQVCARTMFGAFRTRVGMPTRRPRERPALLPLRIQSIDGQDTTLNVPALEHPGPLVLVDWGPPRLMSGHRAGDRVAHRVWAHLPGARGIVEVFHRFSARKVNLPHFYQQPFAQLLAKIGYGFAVATQRAPIEPRMMLPLIVRGIVSDYYDYVGGAQESSPAIKLPQSPGTEIVMHDIRLHVMEGALGRKYLVATISLFAYLGAPRFRVVLAEQGQPKQG